MAPRTATVFSLALFPQVFLFERVLNADVVFVLSDCRLDDHNRANQCALRSASGAIQRVEIPVHRRGVPIDEVDVPESATWFPGIEQQVRRIMDWEKEIVRGATEQRRCYPADSEYWLDLCLQNGCDRFMVGADAEIKYRSLFHREGVKMISQRWQGSASFPARDSILDAVARFSVSDIRARMQADLYR